jgi:mono/diheme cytochrome c family protein
MPTRRNVILSFALLNAVLLVAPSQAQTLDFGTDVWPIFEERCIECHGPDEQEEQLRFDDTEWLTEEELTGAGDITKSLIYELIAEPKSEADRMPGEGDALTREQIVLIRLWLEGGGKAEGWVPPELLPGHGRQSSEPSAVVMLAEGLSAAPDDALAALIAKGALAMPIAQDNNLIRVDFARAENGVSDGDLALLAPVSDYVTWLNLAGSTVTDAGLSAVTTLPKLTRIHLEHTKIGDAGLAHLSSLEHLEYLNLYDTQVGDEGLEHLKPLTHLRKLFLMDSNCTEAGARALEEAIPGLEVTLSIAFVPVSIEVAPDEEPEATEADDSDE